MISGSRGPGLFVFPPDGPMLVFWILVLNVFAAFWAADIIDEKNPDVALGGRGTFSDVGVSGAGVMLESLLGPIFPEPARFRFCDIIFPVGELPFAFASDEACLAAVDRSRGKPGSVGVGGVFTICGLEGSVVGGVRGGSVVSSLD